MSQELQVVRCYSCQTYQTQIVKKSNKWVCKICGEKQSLKKIFGQGSGKDCRVHCQNLNFMQGKKEEESADKILSSGIDSHPEYSLSKEKSMTSQPGNSKWTKYLSQPSSADPEENENNFDEIRPSQICIPTCTPEAFEIPCKKKYKPDSGVVTSHFSEYAIDKEEDFVDDDALKEILKQSDDDLNIEKQIINTAEIIKEDGPIKSAPDIKFSSFLDLMEEEEDIGEDYSDSKKKNVQSCLSQPVSTTCTFPKTPSTSNSFENLGFSLKSRSKREDHAVFKIVPSESFVIEQFKKRISLLEDIDKYTIDELTEMCKF